MGCGLVAMGNDAGDFRFKLGYAQIKLVPRIAVEAFTAYQAGGITADPGAVIFVHCGATSVAESLLSTGVEVR